MKQILLIPTNKDFDPITLDIAEVEDIGQYLKLTFEDESVKMLPKEDVKDWKVKEIEG